MGKKGTKHLWSLAKTLLEKKKHCYNCKLIKNLFEFGLDKNALDKHTSMCSVCRVVVQREERRSQRHFCNKCGNEKSIRVSRVGDWRRHCNFCFLKKVRKNKPLRLRFRLLTKYNFTCQYCGRKPPECVLHIDHLLPKSKGGELEEKNLIVACAECNLGKADLIINWGQN